MVFDLDKIKSVYGNLAEKVSTAREALGRPMPLTEKILYAHLCDTIPAGGYRRGEDYVNFAPDRVAMQDATAQMALLQFMNAGKSTVEVPSSVHCDHLIQADRGAAADIATALNGNREVYDFLESVSNKYGIGFWKPGAGIIHQVILENYAFPGGMMVGTDSHTPNAGGLGMIAIGVGGADAVDVMTGIPWELKMPKIIGVRLTGRMSGWTSPKDVILKLAGILTVKGGTNAIIEYFGDGASTISATGKATICNMGAEVGATTSIFAYDNNIATYLSATSRKEIADTASIVADMLRPDDEVTVNPEKYYDRVIEINLSELEAYINGPFTPDAAVPISEFAAYVKKNGYPERMEVGLIGSCTNSSYEDMARAASVARQAGEKGLDVKAEFIVNPGSELVRATAERDGMIADFEKIGAVVMTNACGPCIGQWTRHTDDKERPNSIITSFNRNFAKRNDGNPNTHAFVASPEIVTALTLAGSLLFNPLDDTILNKEGKAVRLDVPSGASLPTKGYTAEDIGYKAPAESGSNIEIRIDPASKRLQVLAPFPRFEQKSVSDMPILIKAAGKCTTDHISMAGSWLKYRGHLENISDNLLMGAVNSFNGKTNSVLNIITGDYDTVSGVAKDYKSHNIHSIVVAEENYGEGSSREHAAMEPRFLGITVILVKSFARIHETNLKKQGLLALTFKNKEDYNRIGEQDRITILGTDNFTPESQLKAEIRHADGTSEQIEMQHTYNQQQIEWFKAGSALNYLLQNR